MTSDDDFRRRAIRAALTVAGIAVVIGLAIGGLTAGAIYMTGVLPEAQPTPTPTESVHGEDSTPSPSLKTSAPEDSASPSPRQTSRARAKPTPSKTSEPTKTREPERKRPIRLQASASSVGSFEQVTLSGRYPGGNGTTLQVQRREGGSWTSFPTSATVSDGTFSTYVASGQSGPNAFRVVDPSTGRASNVVVVNVS